MKIFNMILKRNISLLLTLIILVTSVTVHSVSGTNKTLSDPTRPLYIIKKKSEDKDIALHGIVKSKGEYFAIINGKKRRTGQYVNGVKIIHIADNKIDIQKNNVTRSIILRQKIN